MLLLLLVKQSLRIVNVRYFFQLRIFTKKKTVKCARLGRLHLLQGHQPRAKVATQEAERRITMPPSRWFAFQPPSAMPFGKEVFNFSWLAFGIAEVFASGWEANPSCRAAFGLRSSK